jgi:Mn-dependent DtxR family transcriptional regulator
MNEQIEIRKILREEMSRLKEHNPAYSLRAFAKKLGLPPPAVSEILNGKRNITLRMATRIFDRLCIDPQRAQGLMSGLRDWGSVKPPVAQKVFLQLQADQFHVISDWWHFAILSLAETRDFDGRPDAIAARLGISVTEAQQATTRLIRLNLLKAESDGKLSVTGIQLRTATDVADRSVRKGHHQSFELAAQSLDQDPVDIRDFSGITMAIDPALLPQAKEMIKNFRRSLCEFLEKSDKREVYQLSIQLFPLSHSKKGME